MDFITLAFFAFAAMAVGSAVGVISVRNPVQAALLLVLTFFSVACTWLLARRLSAPGGSGGSDDVDDETEPTLVSDRH